MQDIPLLLEDDIYLSPLETHILYIEKKDKNIVCTFAPLQIRKIPSGLNIQMDDDLKESRLKFHFENLSYKPILLLKGTNFGSLKHVG